VSGALPGYVDDKKAAWILWVPRTSSTSCDQAVFVDHATNASVFPDAVSVEIDLWVPIIHPCWSGSMPVLVEGAAEPVPSADIQLREPLRTVCCAKTCVQVLTWHFVPARPLYDIL
jgi:hypothetical protein